eukprot:gene17537-20927_t
MQEIHQEKQQQHIVEEKEKEKNQEEELEDTASLGDTSDIEKCFDDMSDIEVAKSPQEAEKDKKKPIDEVVMDTDDEAPQSGEFMKSDPSMYLEASMKFVEGKKQEWFDSNLNRLKREAPLFWTACHLQIGTQDAELARLNQRRVTAYNNLMTSITGQLTAKDFKLIEHMYEDCWRLEWLVDKLRQPEMPHYPEVMDVEKPKSKENKENTPVFIETDDDYDTEISENENWNEDYTIPSAASTRSKSPVISLGDIWSSATSSATKKRKEPSVKPLEDSEDEEVVPVVKKRPRATSDPLEDGVGDIHSTPQFDDIADSENSSDDEAVTHNPLANDYDSLSSDDESNDSDGDSSNSGSSDDSDSSNSSDMSCDESDVSKDGNQQPQQQKKRTKISHGAPSKKTTVGVEDASTKRARKPRVAQKVDDVNEDTLAIRRREEEETQIIQALREERRSQVGREEMIIFPGKIPADDVLLHSDLGVILKPYQREGVRFMWENIVFKQKGCILAHSMGLGKSLQVVSFIHTHHTRFNNTKYLLIVPANTIYNWRNEFNKWLPKQTDGPKLDVFLPRDNAMDIRRDVDRWSKGGGVLVITYEYFVIYSAVKQEDTGKKILDCDIVVVDEGHKIKSANTKTSIAVNQIKTRKRVILTGYPLQNNLKEYYTMINFIRPLHLGTVLEFQTRFIRPIEAGAKSDAPESDFRLMRERLFNLQTLIKDFVSRLGPEMLDKELPKKIDVKGSKIQYSLLSILKGLEKGPIESLEIGTLICNHPDTLLEKKPISLKAINKKSVKELKNILIANQLPVKDCFEKRELVDRILLLNEQRFLYEKSDFSEELESANYRKGIIDNSAKMLVFFELLDQCVEMKERVVTFSSSIATLNLLEYFLQKKGWIQKTDYYRLDGTTRPKERQVLIEKFNDKETKCKLFLISTKAGSLGTNLPGGTRVIMMDLMWNPVHERQAVYRCFRIGQKQQVYVYTLVTAGTLEENIYRRLIYKQSLARRTIDQQTPKRQDNAFVGLQDITGPVVKDTLGINSHMATSDDAVLDQLSKKPATWDHIMRLTDFGTFFESDEIGHLTAEEQAAAHSRFQQFIATDHSNVLKGLTTHTK